MNEGCEPLNREGRGFGDVFAAIPPHLTNEHGFPEILMHWWRDGTINAASSTPFEVWTLQMKWGTDDDGGPEVEAG